MHRIDLGINYLDARYEEFFPVPEVSFEGIQVDRSPKWTGHVGYTFTYPIGDGRIEAGFRTRFSSDYLVTDLVNRTHFVQDGFHKTDVTVTYNAPQDRWYVQGYVRNLEDEITISTAAAGNGGPGAGNDRR
jgi:iron complex outermembrane receptor protein